MRTTRLYALVILMCISQGSPAFAADKKLNTYQRQVNLMKRINDAQKTKQLSVTQAKHLRKDLSKIAVKKQEVRDSASGKNGTGDMSSVNERLTKTSEKIDKLKKENMKNTR